jgi:nicotinamide phosphoribosyltransferase
MKFNPMLTTDAYKVSHIHQLPDKTDYAQVNFTARGSRVEGVDEVVVFGLQAFCLDFMIEQFEDGFFTRPKGQVVREYERSMTALLGPDNGVGTEHIAALHDLGYLPVQINALPEGTRVPLRVPFLTIENTVAGFAWVPGFLETVISNALWMPITSATTANRFRQMLDKWAADTGVPEGFTQFQMHDFSMRGMSSVDAAAFSGAAHLLSAVGSDTLPAIQLLEDYYLGGSEGEMVGVSVSATEHAVMCAGKQSDELETYRRLITQKKTGIISIVSDTWDLWNVATVILPELHDLIMGRDGKVVIRPDSGDPTLILCGNPDAEAGSPEFKGLINLLAEEFGTTTNEAGYKTLDPHIGAIYGEAISFDRAEDILGNLKSQGYASDNIVFGVGSFTYQYVTRDTYGMAIKATWVEVDGEDRNIQKDPVTDNGLKKSAKGRLAVLRTSQGELTLVNEATPGQELSSELRPVFSNGDMTGTLQTLMDIRRRLGTA